MTSRLMKSTTIRLSWPRRALWDNEKASHMVKAAVKRTQRKEAWALALEAKWPRDPSAVLTFRFCPPDRRRHPTQICLRHREPENPVHGVRSRQSSISRSVL